MKTATWKNFLLSLLATTISIVLTFGITAIINHKNERKEKRELVMMVMYDMSNSLQEIESVNSNLRESFELATRKSRPIANNAKRWTRG